MRSTRDQIRWFATWSLVIYVAAVAALAIFNLVLPWPVFPWAEVFYGPAITLSCIFVLFLVGVWIDSRRRRKH